MILWSAIAVLLVAIAVLAGDDIHWFGLSIHREGNLGRVGGAVIGLLFAGKAAGHLMGRRGETIMVVEADRLGYSAPGRLYGSIHIDCLLADIEVIEYQKADGEDEAALAIHLRGFDPRSLFPELSSMEVEAIAAALPASLPVGPPETRQAGSR